MEEKELEHLRKIVKLAFIRIGVRCDLTGFKYLCSAVELVVRRPDLLQNLCKGLYVEIGKQFDAESSGSVERSIRHAIDNTSVNKSFSELNRMFKSKLYAIDDKPTAGELIRLVAEYYLLGLYVEG